MNAIATTGLHSPLPLGITPPRTPEQVRLWEACKGFEQVFSGYLMEELGSKLPGTSKSPGSDFFGGMFRDAIAKQITEGQGLGVAKTLYQKTLPLTDNKIGSGSMTVKTEKSL